MWELGVKVDVRNCFVEKELVKVFDVYGKDLY